MITFVTTDSSVCLIWIVKASILKIVYSAFNSTPIFSPMNFVMYACQVRQDDLQRFVQVTCYQATHRYLVCAAITAHFTINLYYSGFERFFSNSKMYSITH